MKPSEAVLKGDVDTDDSDYEKDLEGTGAAASRSRRLTPVTLASELRAHWAAYLIDWVTVVALGVLALIFQVLVVPYHRYNPDPNGATAYPLLASEVPGAALFGGVVPFPVVVIAIVCFVAPPTSRVTRFLHLHNSVLSYGYAQAITAVVTEVLKTFAGRLRPDFDARDASAQREGRLSFPSGHASLSLCAGAFLFLFIAGNFHFFRQRAVALWKLVAALLFPFAGAMIAVTRTRDYHHNYSDILAGACIGVVGAFLGYASWFRSPFNSKAGKLKLK